MQQPFGQVVGSHPHDPVVVSHVCPPVHALHAAPPEPQSRFDSPAKGTQTPPLQQPLGHEVASQPQVPFVLLQSWPVAHAVHRAPAVPQDALVSDPNGTQVPLAVQQPFGHDVASQTHWPVSVLHS